MRAKNLIGIGGAVTVCGLCFWFGCLWASRGVITYRAGQFRVSFHSDWPTYGLPLAEYKLVLSELRSGHMTNAVRHLEVLLDHAVLDAMKRRLLLHGWRQGELDKAVRKVAQYRQQYPREKIRSGADQATPALPEWSAWVERAIAEEEEVDTFLRGFQPNAPTTNEHSNSSHP